MVIRRVDEIDDDRLSADVCIAGGGAAGITVARALVGSGLSVVLLESGGFEPDAETQDLYGGSVTGTPFGDFDQADALSAVRLRYLGGSTNHWAGFCRPLDAIDLEARPDDPLSGWPFDRAELDGWYDEALAQLGLGPAAFSWSEWADRLDRPDPFEGTELIRTGAYQVRPVRFGTAFREELESADELEVVLGANVVDIRTDGDRVTAMSVRGLDGSMLEVEATDFVLALGGIENARVLLAADVGNENDLVGRHFCEHPQAIIGVATAAADPELLRSVFEEGVALTGAEEAPEPVIRGVLVATEAAARARGLLSFGVQALAGAVDTDAPVAVSGLSAGDVAVYGQTSQGLDTPGVLYLLVTGEQRLDPESRVTLGGSRDALGMPRAEVDWRLSVQDRRSMLDGLRLLGAEFGRSGLGRVQLAPGNLRRADEGGFEVDPAAADPDGFMPGIGFHHMCTTRMSAEATEGVVDADLRVHSTENLFVAGSSSFATAGSSPPTLTIVALALRLADTLQRRAA